ncbi:hypothetical protein [Nocardia nepalensis]|uniref:hypothetical protein n=1 Tax=Nocardia nepalensis TaxID=3375448 RepID=UPI003B678F39
MHPIPSVDFDDETENHKPQLPIPSVLPTVNELCAAMAGSGGLPWPAAESLPRNASTACW